MGQFSRNLMVIAFLERTYCVPSSAMCARHTSLNIELRGYAVVDEIASRSVILKVCHDAPNAKRAVNLI